MAWLSGSAESVAKVRLQQPKIVMPGLDPAIHAAEDVYGRAKPGSRTFLESAAASGFVETAKGHDDLWCLVADGDSARMCKNLSRMAVDEWRRCRGRIASREFLRRSWRAKEFLVHELLNAERAGLPTVS